MFGLGKPHRPQAVAFDILGTVFPLKPLGFELARLGLPPEALEPWFATALRDAFGLAAAGDFAPFAQVLDGALEEVLRRNEIDASAHDRAEVIKAMAELPPRTDALDAFKRLHAAGIAMLAVSNGSLSTTRALLKGAGMDGLFSHIVSVDEVKASKPRVEVYAKALQLAGVHAKAMALVAAHGWDVNGAKAAGLVTAYITAERPLSPVMRRPDLEAATLAQAVDALLALPAPT